jgi:mannose-6-phosphate isomerase-like protein (cupin superfamily)
MRSAATLLLALSLPCFGQKPDTTRVPARFVSAPHTASRPRVVWPPRYELVSNDALSWNSQWLKQHPTRGLTGQTMLTAGDDQTTYLLVRRTVSSEPEVHARWDDLVIVRAGTGVIVLGDSLIDSRYRAPGERIGGRFHKNFQVVVHAGDVVRVPAAVPHQFIVSDTEPLEYLMVKERHQDLPIRWYQP